MKWLPKSSLAALAAVSLFLVRATPLSAQAAADSAAVVDAARHWVEMLDAGETAAALDSAAPLLRQMVGSAQNWDRFLGMARADVPTPVERELIRYEADPKLEATPPGTYRRVAFRVGEDPLVTETVVMAKTDTGWRVAMYGVRGPE